MAGMNLKPLGEEEEKVVWVAPTLRHLVKSKD